jgi:translation initiation factor IF-2
MTRMRVHELAKELNMNNKDLLDRLIKLGIQVKNHMSTLTDSAVEKIRLQFTESKAEKVEEKRIGRAVIRRRKKTAEEEAVSPEVEESVPSEEVGVDAEPFPHPAATAGKPVSVA